jgi:hypothetical protein
MNRPIVIAVLVAGLLAAGAGTAYLKNGMPCGAGGHASSSDPAGATGEHDPTMAAACRFSCAAHEPFDEKDVVAQPGVVDGRLTRCPVSGVVFRVDQARPRVRLARGEYVVCCETCAGKLERHPEQFVL